MNELKIFENAEFGQVRTVTIEGEIWFVGKDVATALGYAKARNAISAHVLDEDKKDAPIQGTPGGTQTMTIINESGLYALILSSKLDSAKRFKHWATSKVLPAIRKHGMYAVDELLENPDIAIKAFTALKEERDKNKALQKDIQRMKPKEVFADAVSASHTSILIGDLAKLLKQNGYETGQKRLFEQLRQEGYLIKGGSSRNMPTQISMDMNLFEVKETSITNPDGSVRVTKTTKVTGKGQQYFINRYLGERKAG